MSPPAVGNTASARRIAQLALPALVVLAAEPLYVLVDTAVVGHLGRVPLAAVAVGGTVMSLAVWFGTLMAYGTTGRAARRFGAGDRSAAVSEGVQASWLALGTGVLLALVVQVVAAPGGGGADAARSCREPPISRRHSAGGGRHSSHGPSSWCCRATSDHR